jgi:hypothetical protein
MYSPDGFASLACAVQGQCWFLGWQEPFVQLMHLFNTPILFFLLQALVWFVLIGVTYFLAKELKVKHLFITPFLILFGTTFFIDNFVGSFENDCFGIILILIAMIYYYRKVYFVSALALLMSLSYWLWAGYLIRIPVFWSQITEVMFWTHWSSYLLLFPIIILCIMSGIKYKQKTKILSMIFILLIPKLFIFGVPTLIKFVDELIDKILKIENKKFYLTIIIFALLVGQLGRVGIHTYNSWNREVEDQDCVTVNDEYFLRATKGLNYTYNQIDIQEREICKQKKLE